MIGLVALIPSGIVKCKKLGLGKREEEEKKAKSVQKRFRTVCSSPFTIAYIYIRVNIM
jgi:hypothetical protein